MESAHISAEATESPLLLYRDVTLKHIHTVITSTPACANSKLLPSLQGQGSLSGGCIKISNPRSHPKSSWSKRWITINYSHPTPPSCESLGHPHHRMVEVGRGLWRWCAPTSLHKQGHLQQVAQYHVHVILASSSLKHTPPWWFALNHIALQTQSPMLPHLAVCL